MHACSIFIVQDNKTLEYTCAPAPSNCEHFWLCNMLNCSRIMAKKGNPSKPFGIFLSFDRDNMILAWICFCAHIGYRTGANVLFHQFTFYRQHLLLNTIFYQLTYLFLGRWCTVHPPQFLSRDYHPTLVISNLDYHSLADHLSPHSETPTASAMNSTQQTS